MLAARGDVKVAVAPRLELGVQPRVVAVAQRLPVAVEGGEVVWLHVVGCQVAAASVPRVAVDLSVVDLVGWLVGWLLKGG